MSTRNISISDDAYARLAALKKPNESFSQVIRRITGKRSILELAGILSEQEAREFKQAVGDSRKLSKYRLAGIEKEWKNPTGSKEK